MGTMETREFELNGEYVRLCDLLKLAGLATSGAHGKQRVADGEVKVDGQVESRKTAKIRAGQAVQCGAVRVMVVGK
jgi:ribosome-associated protein